MSIDGIPYVDGGLRQNTPLSPALRLGSSRILVVGVSHEKRPRDDLPHKGGLSVEALGRPIFMMGKVLNALMLVTAIILVLSLTRRARPKSDTLGVGLEWGLAIALSLTTSPLSWVHYSTMAIVAFIVLLASTYAPDWRAAPKHVREIGRAHV